MHFRPLHDRVLVRRIDAEEKTAGGIIIPDTAKEKPQEGEVIAAGPGGRNEQGQLVPLDVKAGDRVLFGKWSGTEVKIDGQDLLIVKESDLLGVVEHHDKLKKAPKGAKEADSHRIERRSGSWLPRKSNFQPRPASACCGAWTRWQMR